MKTELALELLENVADEWGYHFEQIGASFWELYIDRSHGISYGITLSSSGYLEICHWEGEQYGDGKYGRAVYSLRTIGDVTLFCNVISLGAELRAKRC